VSSKRTRRSIRLHRTLPAAHVQGRPADAEQTLKLGAQNNPTQFGYLTLLAMHYYMQKQRGRWWTSSTRSNPTPRNSSRRTSPWAILSAHGDGVRRPRVSRGIAKDVKRKATYEKRIIEVLMRQGKRTEAADLNSQILKDDPDDNDARGLAATFMLDKGDVAKALSELQSS